MTEDLSSLRHEKRVRKPIIIALLESYYPILLRPKEKSKMGRSSRKMSLEEYFDFFESRNDTPLSVYNLNQVPLFFPLKLYFLGRQTEHFGKIFLFFYFILFIYLFLFFIKSLCLFARV